MKLLVHQHKNQAPYFITPLILVCRIKMIKIFLKQFWQRFAAQIMYSSQMDGRWQTRKPIKTNNFIQEPNYLIKQINNLSKTYTTCPDAGINKLYKHNWYIQWSGIMGLTPFSISGGETNEKQMLLLTIIPVAVKPATELCC